MGHEEQDVIFRRQPEKPDAEKRTTYQVECSVDQGVHLAQPLEVLLFGIQTRQINDRCQPERHFILDALDDAVTGSFGTRSAKNFGGRELESTFQSGYVQRPLQAMR